MSVLGVLEGRARPREVLGSLEALESLEMSEESWVVNARVDEEGAVCWAVLDLLGRGWPYMDWGGMVCSC